MLTIYKDEANTYPVSALRPLTFLVPESGGKKEVNIWIVTDLAGAVLKVEPIGSDQTSIAVMLRPGGQDWIPGAPYNCPVTLDGPSVNIQMPIQITVPAGGLSEFNLLGVRVTAYSGEDVLDSVDANCRVIQADQRLNARFRALPSNRQIRPTLAGFRFGSYRWRDIDQVNAQEIVPTNWNIDPVAVGTEKFIAGIGYRDDLELVDLERQNHSVFPRIRHGFYFTGHQGYFCPSQDAVLQIVPATQGLQFAIPRRPAQLPVFVGTYRQDDHGYYDTDVSYRCVGKGFTTPGSFDADDPGPQFVLDRSGLAITLNSALDVAPVFAGFAPAAPDATDITIDIPVYPITQIVSVYLDTPDQTCNFDSVDPVANTVHVMLPADCAGSGIFINYVPALAVAYEAVPEVPDTSAASTDGTRLLSLTDFNPAFSGLSRGFLYLMHRKHKPGAIQLAADKPRILVPATLSSVVGLVAFGPTYYENDYALLMASVTGNTSQEFIPNVRLRIVPGADFQGFINYRDPLAEDVEVVSGGDGNASFVYTPPKAYGFYLDGAASVAGARITLPEPVALTQIWNPDEQWMPTTYIVRDDHPFLGKVGANIEFGEVPWQTWNQTGTIQYRTNGLRQVWRDSQGLKIYPTQAYDTFGVAALIGGALNPAFSGNAVVLEYANALPTADNIGAYFLSFIGRIQIQVEDTASGLISNSILLQLEAPPEIQDAPDVSGYLYLGLAEVIKQGRLGVNRLGSAPIPQFAFSAPRY